MSPRPAADRVAFATLILLTSGAGCFSHGPAVVTTPPAFASLPLPPDFTPHALTRPVPAELTPPTFADVSVATIYPAALAADAWDTGVGATPDGKTLVATAACDRPEPIGPSLQPEQLPKCDQRPVYVRGTDKDLWTRVNKDPKGRIDRKTHTPQGQVDVAADDNGTVWVAMPDRGYNEMFLYRSNDGKDWTWLPVGIDHVRHPDGGGPAFEEGRITASGPGGLLATWRSCASTNYTYCWVGLTAWHDTGYWGPRSRLGDHVWSVGPARWGIQHTAFVAYIDGPRDGVDGRLFVGASDDDGAHWTPEVTPFRAHRAMTTQERNGTFSAPYAIPLGDGSLALAWTDEETPTPAFPAAWVSHVAVRGPDGTWSQPTTILAGTDAMVLGAVPGGGTRFALSILTGAAVGADAAEAWDLRVVIAQPDGAALKTVSSLVATGIHRGSFCAGSTPECQNSLAHPRLAFAGLALTPRGTLLASYVAEGASDVALHVATQTGGSALFLPTS